MCNPYSSPLNLKEKWASESWVHIGVIKGSGLDQLWYINIVDSLPIKHICARASQQCVRHTAGFGVSEKGLEHPSRGNNNRD